MTNKDIVTGIKNIIGPKLISYGYRINSSKQHYEKCLDGKCLYSRVYYRIVNYFSHEKKEAYKYVELSYLVYDKLLNSIVSTVLEELQITTIIDGHTNLIVVDLYSIDSGGLYNSKFLQSKDRNEQYGIFENSNPIDILIEIRDTRITNVQTIDNELADFGTFISQLSIKPLKPTAYSQNVVDRVIFIIYYFGTHDKNRLAEMQSEILKFSNTISSDYVEVINCLLKKFL
ncbi:MAG: hypothetical protein KG003_07580 [Bacteroidetes bacterium]|nr:hypothetical protein [Bacteroidota bacterium]